MSILKKLTSRKFLLAVIGMVAGIAMSFGVEGSEIVELVSTIGGVLTALGCAVSYINAEAKVDAASAGAVKLVLQETEVADAEA